MLPIVAPRDPRPNASFYEDDEFAELYEREDGSVYARVDPEQFALFDEVDSRTITDPGAPQW